MFELERDIQRERYSHASDLNDLNIFLAFYDNLLTGDLLSGILSCHTAGLAVGAKALTGVMNVCDDIDRAASQSTATNDIATDEESNNGSYVIYEYPGLASVLYVMSP